ncbi:hypothetical protein ABW19_dt0209240 [Dactylella cylindrospora]|nr:hypothetical protein ABW19_dt0209240 [Dactylella cylindrospora]
MTSQKKTEEMNNPSTLFPSNNIFCFITDSRAGSQIVAYASIRKPTQRILATTSLASKKKVENPSPKRTKIVKLMPRIQNVERMKKIDSIMVIGSSSSPSAFLFGWGTSARMRR